MNIKEIAEYKKVVISKAMDKAFNTIFQDFDKDSTFELADDELTELIYELMVNYLQVQK